jgi:Tol biopolymer transport system component
MKNDSARSSRRLIVVMLALIAFASIVASTTTNSSVARGSGNARFPEGTGLFGPVVQTGSGQKIVFGSVRNNGNHDIFVMDADGNNQTRLTTHLAYDDQPKWSPDGAKIVFMSGRDGNFEIYSMNADGSGQTRLTNNPAADGFPAWSPDGSRIAFVSGNLGNPSSFEIFVMNANGTNRTQLTSDLLVDAVPAWSPDSAKIVFMSGSTSVFDPNSFEIFVINADGSNRTRLTNNTIADGQPSFSPNGTKILFASGDAMNPNGVEIFVMNADGNNRTRLTTNAVTDGFPAWSSDGSKIVFASGNVADETTVELFVMNTDGSNRTMLTTNSVLDWFPDWQPISTPSTIQLSATSFSANEAVGSMSIMVTRTGGSSGTAAVDYATSDTAGANPCGMVNGNASSRCDYLTTLGTLQFAAGETSKNISIPIIDDVYAEGVVGETFTITLTNATGATLGAPATATLTITDNDSANGTSNPIDVAGFFVRQHYVDFLNREPDTSGLNFWTGEITQCGADPQCIEIKRINVSAAFFLSIEFQQTGYLVHRVYKASYGDATGTSTLGETHQLPVPIVRLNEFLPDTQRIGRGVIVGQPGWEQVLDNNKQAYCAEFVQRTRFATAFASTLTPPQFVDALFAKATVVPSATERQSAIDEFLGAGTSADLAARGRALRRVAENGTLSQQEFNRAFVLMQFFGYMRRNPNDPQDMDYTGYDFWLGKLNQFNGNFVNAEMVKAFITSIEYRHRFGP